MPSPDPTRNPCCEALVLDKIQPYFADHLRGFHAAAMALLDSKFAPASEHWPRAEGAPLFFPFKFNMEAASQEYVDLKAIAAHVVPQDELASVLSATKALRSDGGDSRFVLPQCHAKLDSLRVQAAKLLVAVVDCKAAPAVMAQPGSVEKLIIPQAMLAILHAFKDQAFSFKNSLKVDTTAWQPDDQAEMQTLAGYGEDGLSWLRFLCKELSGWWESAIVRLKANIERVFPDDYWEFTVESRDDSKILEHIVNNEELENILPMTRALKAGVCDVENTLSTIHAGSLNSKLKQSCDSLDEKSKVLLGIRASSTVTLVRLPEATSQKSKVSYIRECKRLVKALQITLPTAVLNALEAAGAEQPPP